MDLKNDAFFIEPDRLVSPYSWVGHIPFVSWLLTLLKPDVFVELGTHTGNSYNAACQAIMENNLSTRAYAVDTWQGDEHAGLYSDCVFEELAEYHQPRYGAFSSLLRMTFDDALDYFPNGSVDLLHIDGLHTYEAVKHDFETWLPKLSKRAVVLFHDTYVFEKNFGVNQLWLELVATYPGFNFGHCNGLGVLLVGEQRKPLLSVLADPISPNPEWQHVSNLFRVLGQRLELKAFGISLARELDIRTHELDIRTHELDIRTRELDVRRKELANRNERIAWLMADVVNHKEIVKEREKWIAILQRELAEREAQVAALTQTTQALEQKLAERDANIVALNQTIVATRDEFMHSASWRLTKPVRFLGNLRRQLTQAPAAELPPGDGLPAETMPNEADTPEATAAPVETLPSEAVADADAVEAAPNEAVADADAADAAPSVPADSRNDYGEWVRRYDSLDEAACSRILERIETLPRRPKISVLMPVYDPPLAYLDAAILSVRQQLYPDWELCIADDMSKNQAVRDLLSRHADEDARIRVIFRAENGHIANSSNSALALASGEFVALLDHDDLLPGHALFCVAEAILAHPDTGLIYSDEDKIDPSGQRREPYFKSDWNPDLFLSHNMVSHLGVYRTALVNAVGGFRVGFEGSQDYDLALRCIEKLNPGQIVHIPRVLYHWRAHPASTATSFEAKPYAVVAGERALTEHLARCGISAWVESLDFGMYRVHYTLPVPPPLVSLIIPTRNGLRLIRQCVESILAKTQYPNYEILIVDNNSDDPETLDYLRGIAENPKIRVIRDERPFNFSALNNAAVKLARGELVGLVNNDIEVIAPEWLDEMASLALQPGVGAVGARLWYPDDTLQHGGVILGLCGIANHSHHRLRHGSHGYLARASLMQSFSAVTAACLLISKSTYEQVGGLNESDLPVAYNDVDFCLRLREAGYRTVWTPYAELYHYESASRGREDTVEKKQRSSNENFYMQARWETQLANDPAYSPNLTLEHMDFSLAWPPRVPRL